MLSGCQNNRSYSPRFADGTLPGLKVFGYDTYWANRLNLPVEELDVLPDSVGAGMKELMRLATGS